MLNIIAFYKQEHVALLKIHDFSLFSIHGQLSFVVFHRLATSRHVPAPKKKNVQSTIENIKAAVNVMSKIIDLVFPPFRKKKLFPPVIISTNVFI